MCSDLFVLGVCVFVLTTCLFVFVALSHELCRLEKKQYSTKSLSNAYFVSH